MINQFVLVRTFSAGVHLGTLVSREGKEVTLKDARRLWCWYGAFTLSAVATKGIDWKNSRLSEPVPEIVLTEAIEIMPVAPELVEKFQATEAYSHA